MQAQLLPPRITAGPCASRAQPPHQHWQRCWTPPAASRAASLLQASHSNTSDGGAADAEQSQSKVRQPRHKSSQTQGPGGVPAEHQAPGAPNGKLQVRLRPSMKGRVYSVNGGYYSQEGGAESLLHYRQDALQLAAHELGGKQARTTPPGIHIVTAAGKEYFSRLRPFQKSKLTEWEDTEQAIAIIQQDIEFRMEEIYEQLLKWPQSSFAPLQADIQDLIGYAKGRHIEGASNETLPVQLAIRIKGRTHQVYGGKYSQEGGADSLFHFRRDALQLAAHELGGRPAKTVPRGMYVVTAAGKDFFSKLRPFQESKVAEYRNIAQATETLKQDIEFRMVEIYEQLLKWPQSPLAPLQGDMHNLVGYAKGQRIKGRRSALPPGTPRAKGQVQLALSRTIWGSSIIIYGGVKYSHEGGTESPFCRRTDALLLAAHELGGTPAKDTPPGVSIATAAGREYLKMLKPFQKSPLAESEDVASARAEIKAAIRARADVIYEQLLRWPQVQFEPQP